MSEPKWVAVAPRSALGDGAMLGVEVGDHVIAVYDVDGELYATDNTCTHAFAMLTDGFLDGDIVEVAAQGGLAIRARRHGDIAEGQAVEAYARPEAFDLARDPTELSPAVQRLAGRVESLLFDGANSAVLVRETRSHAEIRIALPQTGRFADLAVGETIAFGFEPARAACFAVGSP